MNVLFFREHNRICDVLKGQKNPPKDDEQLFQTARNVLIVLLIKIVIEEYINHITPYHFKFRLQPAAFEGAQWYRQNWMAVEFNLLYRWHGLVPDTYRIGGREIPLAEMDFHNRLLIDRGLGGLLEDASRQPAGRIGLFNTPESLLEVEKKSIELGRLAGLDTYNAYRKLCRFPEVTSFDQISGDPRVQDALKDLYKTVDRIEYYPGLFAEDTRTELGPAFADRPARGGRRLLAGADQPLTGLEHLQRATFTPAGLEIIETTQTLSDILHRNLPAGSPTLRGEHGPDRDVPIATGPRGAGRSAETARAFRARDAIRPRGETVGRSSDVGSCGGPGSAHAARARTGPHRSPCEPG